MKKLLGAMILFGAMVGQSKADVLYQWDIVENNTQKNISLLMDFTDDVVAQGSLQFNTPFYAGHELHPYDPPLHGLKSIVFSADNIPRIYYQESSTERFMSGLGIIHIYVKFAPEGFLTGNIYLNDTQTDVGMVSDGAGLFTLNTINSDAGGWRISCDAYDGPHPCAWSSGMLRRDIAVGVESSSVAYVPEPSSFALIGLGLFGLSRARRYAKK